MQTEKLLNTEEAAELLRISAWTLKSWRCNKTINIPVVQIGRKVFYKKSVIEMVIEGKSFDALIMSSPSTKQRGNV